MRPRLRRLARLAARTVAAGIVAVLASCAAWRTGDLEPLRPLSPAAPHAPDLTLGYRLQVRVNGREFDPRVAQLDRRPISSLPPHRRIWEEEVARSGWFAGIHRGPAVSDVEVDLDLALNDLTARWLRIANRLTLGLLPVWGRQTWTLNARVRGVDGRTRTLYYEEATFSIAGLIALPLAPFFSPEPLWDRVFRDLFRHVLEDSRAAGAFGSG